MVTCRASINVSDGKTVLKVGDEEVVFRLLEAVRHPLDYDYAMLLEESLE